MENFIYVGETVEFKGRKALVFQLDLPHVVLLVGERQKRVRFDKLVKISQGGIVINILDN